MFVLCVICFLLTLTTGAVGARKQRRRGYVDVSSCEGTIGRRFKDIEMRTQRPWMALHRVHTTALYSSAQVCHTHRAYLTMSLSCVGG